MNIGERIKTSRQSLELSQRKLAEILKIKFQTVQAWESGRAQPKGSRLPEVAKTLNISAEWLLTGKGNIGTFPTKTTGLTAEEMSILNQFRTLSSNKRAVIKSLLDVMVEAE